MKTSVYQFNLGEYCGYVLNDFAQVHTAKDVVANPIIAELEEIADEYAFKMDNVPVGYNNLLLRTGDRNVLVDAGIQKPIGKLCLGLQELGIDPGDIDTIVITHSDRDHIGGILDEEGEIAFPNAQYVMLEDAWQYWATEERRSELTALNQWTKDKTEFVWEIFSTIKERMRFVQPGEEFIPGLRLFPAPGHRCDHAVLRVTSAGEDLMHLSDAIVHPLFMAKRDWYSTFDSDPTQAVETKNEFLTICASENLLVFAAHFPFPGLGYVQQDHKRWKWIPISESE